MHSVLEALVAFVAEHRRCGSLESGSDNGYTWLTCSCGARIKHPTNAPLRAPESA